MYEAVERLGDTSRDYGTEPTPRGSGGHFFETVPTAPVEDNPQLADTTHTTERHPALVPSALRFGNPDSTVKPSHGVVRSESQVERGTTPL